MAIFPARYRRHLLRLLAVLLAAPPLLILLLRFIPPPATPLMLLRAAQGHGLERQWVAYAAMAPSLAEAVIASEDNLFCRQPLGVDLGALRGQLLVWDSGGRPRGASTLTMQVAKNLFLWPGRDPLRKLLELWLTPQIALLWPKQRVLEVYLNVAELGPGLYGAEAAAQRYFHKPAGALTMHEAALLAGLLPNPLERAGHLHGGDMQRRAGRIAERVEQIVPLLDCTR